MDDVSAGAFRMFVQWLYSQRLDDNRNYDSAKGGFWLQWETDDMYLAELWVLAEKLLIPHLQNAAIESILHFGSKMLEAPIKTFNYIYEHTDDSENPLRRLAVYLCMVFVDIDQVSKELLPKDFLWELSCAWQRDFRGPFWSSGEGRISSVCVPAPHAREFFVYIEGEVQDDQWVSEWEYEAPSAEDGRW